jgi:hypothetical protein
MSGIYKNLLKAIVIFCASFAAGYGFVYCYMTCVAG